MQRYSHLRLIKVVWAVNKYDKINAKTMKRQKVTTKHIFHTKWMNYKAQQKRPMKILTEFISAGFRGREAKTDRV